MNSSQVNREQYHHTNMESETQKIRSRRRQIKSESGKELLHLRTRSSKQSTKTSLLQNGCILPSIQIENKNIKVLNTCPFDVILQILSIAYLDNKKYKNVVTENTKNNFFNIVLNYAKDGPASTIYVKRAMMLCELYPAIRNRVYCHDNANGMIEKFFKDIPSIIESSKCINCNEMSEKKIPILHVDSKFILEKGMKIGLQESIVESLKPNNVHCLKCNMNTLLVAREPGVHLFVDVENVFMPFLMKTLGFKQTIKNINLHEFPIEIQIESDCYKFHGLIVFKKATQKQGIGHYIAYCLRSNGLWEEHDDMTEAVFKLKFHDKKQICHSLSTIVLTKQ